MNKKPIAVLVFIFCLIGFVSIGQISQGKLSSTDRQNLQTVQEAIKYLKAQKTKSFTSFDSTSMEVLNKQYQGFFNAYFDVAYITDSAGEQSIMSLPGQTLLVYNIDHYLDVLPLDSIFISPLSFFDKKEAEADRHHTLITYIKVDGKVIYIHSLLFNEKGKIKGIAPYIDFEHKHDGIDITGFYNRQKGYDKIKDKIYIF